MPKLSRIMVFPVKSLDGREVASSEVLSHGALADDRRWALVSDDGRFLNGKATATVHSIRTQWIGADRSFALSAAGCAPARFTSMIGPQGPGAWLTAALGQRCRVEENTNGGFPDDTDARGPTVISTATIETLASWFPGTTVDSVRRRLRTNLEIDAPEPFWEDRLVDQTFSLGGVRWRGVNVCQRCVVPARDPDTGEAIAGFQKRFAQRRRETLPGWSPAEQFNHYYRVAINTRPADAFTPGVITVGDELAIHK